MDEMHCQSFGMPMRDPAQFGTEGDGTLSPDYCSYCYGNGTYLHEMSMEDMLSVCADHVDDWDVEITRDEAVAMMREFFPTLKRWQ